MKFHNWLPPVNIAYSCLFDEHVKEYYKSLKSRGGHCTVQYPVSFGYSAICHNVVIGVGGSGGGGGASSHSAAITTAGAQRGSGASHINRWADGTVTGGLEIRYHDQEEEKIINCSWCGCSITEKTPFCNSCGGANDRKERK